jgi:hypothetical protein
VEKIKAIIDFYKTIFLVFVTAMLSMIGFLFLNFFKLSFMQKFLIFYTIIVFTVGVITVILNWWRYIRKLKD